MRKWLVGLLALVAAGCGEDPQGPPIVQTVEAVVTIDWPLAREPGFVDATYVVKVFDFDTGTLAKGSIPPTGETRARFIAKCGPNHPEAYIVTFRGHFTQYVGIPIARDEGFTCGRMDAFSFPDCEDPTYTTEPKNYGVPRWQCEPPVE